MNLLKSLRGAIAVATLCVGVASSFACTNFLIGKDASADGSTMVSYNMDAYGMYGILRQWPAAKHAPGEMRHIVDTDHNHYRGAIAEAPETYAVIGQINEHQVSITETTWVGREELVNNEGVIDYVSLMTLGLQRSRTAREAIKVMTSLVAEYGYGSSGETFSVCDPNEIWILEMIGKGAGRKGAVWVAVRIPDDCICCHANQSRIRQFNRKDKQNVLYSPDVITFAREMGYFNGKDADFSFCDAYSPTNFHMQRACEARVWSFFNRFVSGMERYLPYADGAHIGSCEVMPLYFKPDHKVSLRECMDGMRDHYEGTPFDMTVDCGGGAWQSPYRPRPQEWDIDGKRYFHERPIASQQCCQCMVCQMRNWLPNEVGGVMWFGNDDAAMVPYTPIYCSMTRVPKCYNSGDASDVKFSWNSAFWVCNWVSNMVYPFYSRMYPDLKRVRERLQDKYCEAQQQVENNAMAIYRGEASQRNEFDADNSGAMGVKEYLTRYGEQCAAEMMAEWKQLGEFLIVKHTDMAVKQEKDGKFLLNEDGLCMPPLRMGYGDDYRRVIVNQTGDKYLVPEQK
ncbi:MAG: dipeptidase [Muribaculaceae bacterium]